MYVGIDVSKDFLDVWSGSASRCPNTPGDAEVLTKTLKKVTLVVVEATGGYEQWIVQALQKRKIPVSVVNPKRVRDFARCTGKLSKTDEIDARILAEFAQTLSVKLRQTDSLSPEQRDLKELCALREDLSTSVVQYKNRIKQASSVTKPHLQSVLTHLKSELEQVQQKINDLLKNRHEAKVIQSVKGLGPVLTAVLLAEIPELGHCNEKEIAALAGLAPFNCDSGLFRGKRRIWGGRKRVRNAMYLAANIARRYDSKMNGFFNKLREAGKPFKVAIIACARRLLVILNAKLRDCYLAASC